MIQCFKNKHIGETCLVIGNGPSLKDVPNSFLDQYPSFGTNRIFLKYVPTYYVVVNPLVIEQNKAIIEILPCDKFLPFGYDFKCEHHGFLASTQKQFSHNPDKWIAEGFTVTYGCLQLAYYMGFTTVLLVGVDHRYKFSGEPNEPHLFEGDDPNHFDPEYFKGVKWHNPDLERSEISYQYAKEAFEQDHRKIINLTPNTALNVFEKGNINDWLGNHSTRKK